MNTKSSLQCLWGLLCCVAMAAGAEETTRDFSGLWTPAVSRGAVGWPAEPPYTDWGRQQWEAYVTE